MLPWLIDTFELPPPAWVIRHPCATIASQLREGSWTGAGDYSESEYIQKYPEHEKIVKQASTLEEKLACRWAIDHVLPISEGASGKCCVISYEKMVAEFDEVLTRLAADWSVDATSVDLVKLRYSASVTTSNSGVAGIDGWTRRLSKDQISQILGVVHAFGITCYDSDPCPDRKAFESWLSRTQVSGSISGGCHT